MRSLHQLRPSGTIFALTLALLCATLSAPARADETGCAPTKLAANYPSLVGKIIKIGQDGESVPFSQRDPKDLTKLIGLDADLARAAFGCVGVPVDFTVGAWSGLIPAAMAGQIDLMWDTLLYTPERAKKLDFVVYMNAATGMLVAKDNPRNVHALTDLCGLNATTQLGTTQEAMLRDADNKCLAAGKPAVTLILSQDMPSSLRLVQSGRADLAAVNKFVGDSMIASSPDKVQSAFDVVTGAKIAVGTAKGNPDLVKAIKDGLTAIRANGTEKTIYEKYHVDYSLTTDPTLLTE
jgi:polar amino acid transport system substrate-binding protein